MPRLEVRHPDTGSFVPVLAAEPVVAVWKQRGDPVVASSGRTRIFNINLDRPTFPVVTDSNIAELYMVARITMSSRPSVSWGPRLITSSLDATLRRSISPGDWTVVRRELAGGGAEDTIVQRYTPRDGAAAINGITQLTTIPIDARNSDPSRAVQSFEVEFYGILVGASVDVTGAAPSAPVLIPQPPADGLVVTGSIRWSVQDSGGSAPQQLEYQYREEGSVGGFESRTVTIPGNLTAAIVLLPKANTRYEMRIRLRNLVGFSPLSNTAVVLSSDLAPLVWGIQPANPAENNAAAALKAPDVIDVSTVAGWELRVTNTGLGVDTTLAFTAADALADLSSVGFSHSWNIAARTSNESYDLTARFRYDDGRWSPWSTNSGFVFIFARDADPSAPDVPCPPASVPGQVTNLTFFPDQDADELRISAAAPTDLGAASNVAGLTFRWRVENTLQPGVFATSTTDVPELRISPMHPATIYKVQVWARAGDCEGAEYREAYETPTNLCPDGSEPPCDNPRRLLRRL